MGGRHTTMFPDAGVRPIREPRVYSIAVYSDELAPVFIGRSYVQPEVLPQGALLVKFFEPRDPSEYVYRCFAASYWKSFTATSVKEQ